MFNAHICIKITSFLYVFVLSVYLFLLYVRRENIGCSIQKMTPGGKNVIMFTSDSNMIMCIHSSKINMDLIVCVHNKTNNSVQLARYGSTGETIASNGELNTRTAPPSS